MHDQFVAGTQVVNSVSFVFDGVNFGASDFAYSAYSMASFSTLISYCGILIGFGNIVI